MITNTITLNSTEHKESWHWFQHHIFSRWFRWLANSVVHNEFIHRCLRSRVGSSHSTAGWHHQALPGGGAPHNTHAHTHTHTVQNCSKVQWRLLLSAPSKRRGAAADLCIEKSPSSDHLVCVADSHYHAHHRRNENNVGQWPLCSHYYCSVSFNLP